MPECSVETLALWLRDGKGDGRRKAPRFALFLGAGASIESGIPGTAAMMKTFRERLQERWRVEGENGSFEEWLRAQPHWDADASEYSNLFEVFEPTARGRARHIQELVTRRGPSFGYFCLSQLLSQDVIDVVLTTNFDDLVYEACAQWTGTRPRVYAYGTPTGPVRREAGRPTIVKLHGDFLYSALKNTDHEVSSPDPNMEPLVNRLQDDYELIVIGYGGNDASIMKLFEATPDDAGIYWCLREAGAPPKRLQEFLRRPNAFTVTIEGFDRFMDELLHAVGFRLPDAEEQVREQQQAIVRMVSDSSSRYKDDYLGQAGEQSTEEWLRAGIEGKRAYERKAYDEAIAAYRKSLELRPNHPATLFGLGLALARNGQLDDAVAAYRKSLELRPDDPATLNNLGIALSDNGQLDEAVAAYRRSLDVRPDDPGTLHNLGSALSDNGQFDEAIAAYRKALELQPDDPDTFHNLGIALRQSGQFDEAIAAYRKALELRPDDPDTLNSLGVALTLAGEGTDGRQVFERVIELTKDQTSVEPQMNAGIALVGAGRGYEGLAVFGELAAKKPLPQGDLRNALGDLKGLARAAVAWADQCVQLIEKALGDV